MKPGPNSKRSRGRGNPRRPNNNNPRTQVYESNGPEVRIRGTVNQVLEKYLALARDASSSGDHVSAENFFQHAEHYFRILSANGGFHNGLQRFRPGVPQGQPGQQQNQPQGQPRPNDPQQPNAQGGQAASSDGNGSGETGGAPGGGEPTAMAQPDAGTPEN